VVDHHDLVIGHVRIGLVAANLFLDEGLTAGVQWRAAAIEWAETFKKFAPLDLKHIVAGIAVGIDPMTN
jgi:hypothetical protein